MKQFFKSWEELATRIGGIQAAAFYVERPAVRHMTDLKGEWVKVYFDDDVVVVENAFNPTTKGGE